MMWKFRKTLTHTRTREKETASKRIEPANGVAVELQKKIDAVVSKEGIGGVNVYSLKV